MPAARSLEVGRQAARAGVDRHVLTHLQPGTDPEASHDAARSSFEPWIGVATADLEVRLD